MSHCLYFLAGLITGAAVLALWHRCRYGSMEKRLRHEVREEALERDWKK